MDDATLERFLALVDEGATVDALREFSGLGQTRVYSLLKEYRPNRARQPRRRTSDVPTKIRGLAAEGIRPIRIAFLLGITSTYVYRVLAESS